jgi:hypothetical protein
MPAPIRLAVRSTVDLLAVVPYLLGFHPTDSLVVVAMRGGQMVFAARSDLPRSQASAAARTAFADQLARVVARQGAQTASVIGYGPPDRVAAAVRAVCDALTRCGLEILDALRVTAGRYWSLLCADPECCPPDGTAFDVTTSALTAAAVFAGQVVLPDRTALTRQVAPACGQIRESMRRATERAVDRLATLIVTQPVTGPDAPAGRSGARPVGADTPATTSNVPVAGSGARPAGAGNPAAESGVPAGKSGVAAGEPGTRAGTELGAARAAVLRAGKAVVREALSRAEAGGRLTDDEVAWLTLLLCHQPVRDFAWERITPDEWQIALWTDVLQRAEPDLAPAPASLLAFAAWRSGLGALASVALERALGADPAYPMALLLDDMLRSGLPPSILDGWPALGRRARRRRRRRGRTAGHPGGSAGDPGTTG